MPSADQWWMIRVEPGKAAAQLLQWRLSTGLSQDKLSQKFGWQQRDWSQYETGERLPNPQRVRQLEDYFGVEEDDLQILVDIDSRNRRRAKRIPASSWAVPNTPQITELLRAIEPLSLEDIGTLAVHATHLLESSEAGKAANQKKQRREPA